MGLVPLLIIINTSNYWEPDRRDFRAYEPAIRSANDLRVRLNDYGPVLLARLLACLSALLLLALSFLVALPFPLSLRCAGNQQGGGGKAECA